MSGQAELHDIGLLARLADAVGNVPKTVRSLLANADQDAVPRLRRVEQRLRLAQERIRSAARAAEDAPDEERREAAAELEEAREALARMQAAYDRVQEALRDYRRSARALNDIEWAAAHQFLRERVDAARAYLAIQAGAGFHAGSAVGTAAHAPDAGPVGLPVILPPLPSGYAWIPIDRIEKPAGALEWKKVDRSTVVAGMSAFARDLIPLLCSGNVSEDKLMAFDDDHERRGPGAVHPESLLNLHAIMFGSDPIGTEKSPDGVYRVASGRHRIEVARSLGWTHVPAFVVGAK